MEVFVTARTADLYFSAYLVVAGFTLEDVCWVGSRCYFSFQMGSQEMSKHRDLYHGGSARVCPQAYARALIALKAQLHRR